MKLWNIEINNYNNLENRKYETVFTLANGYKGLRGALEFSKIGNKGNFISGIFDKSQAQVTEIVNCQDPLGFNVYVEDELIDFEECKIENFRRELNMREGILCTEFEATTRKGRTVEIKTERYLSRKNVNRWAAKYEIIPKNFKGKVFVENYIDGSVTNSAWEVMLKSKHFQVTGVYDCKPGIALQTQTFDNKIDILEMTRLIAEDEKGNIFRTRRYSEFGEQVVEAYEMLMNEGQAAIVYKYGVTYTSRDTDENLYVKAVREIDSFIREGYYSEKSSHIDVWNDIWKAIDIKIDGDDKAQVGIRYNLFQLSSSAYAGDERVSIAAKALHGEGYKGHVFWDTEVFMLPFFIYTRPEVARALLMYRYNTLKGARENAKDSGFKGARFPWEAADDGTEVTPKWGIDYLGNPVRIWTGDIEYHINSDIAFGIIEYHRATGDDEFLINYGMEILLDTAKFWQSRVEYNDKEDRYEINCVIGPDEFHEHVNNNVFTNYLAKWNMEKALYYKEWLKEKNEDKLRTLCNLLGINEEDFNKWKVITKKIYIPTSKDGMLIEQFEGYFDLEYYPIVEHDENGMPMWPKGLKLDKLNESQIIKQADVVQLMLMLPEEFSKEMKKINYEYYEARTMHKSSLSPSMYSILGLAVGDTNNAYKYFMKTVYTDLEDNQGNTDFGLHAASTGGSWQSAVFGFAGLSVDKDGDINLNPWIPEHWEKLQFNINWRGARITFAISQKDIKVISTDNIVIKIYENKYEIVENDLIVVAKK